jgi:hypothetical protein
MEISVGRPVDDRRFDDRRRVEGIEPVLRSAYDNTINLVSMAAHHET